MDGYFIDFSFDTGGMVLLSFFLFNDNSTIQQFNNLNKVRKIVKQMEHPFFVVGFFFFSGGGSFCVFFSLFVFTQTTFYGSKSGSSRPVV